MDDDRSYLATILVVAMLIGASVWPNTAFADPGNSGATITGWFSDSCRNFEAVASKDISHVEISYLDGRMTKDEDIDNQDFSIDSDAGDEFAFVIVKSGTTEKRFDCFSSPSPVCSDGIDNDGNGAIDYPADPGCSGPDDNDEGSD